MIAAFLAHSLEANLSLVIKVMTTNMDIVIDNETFVSVSTARVWIFKNYGSSDIGDSG